MVPQSSRFELRRRVGEGGFGVVYEAYDREWNATVALKMLRSTDGPALIRFKREFRSLADVRHRNLVKLHELHVEPSCVYFTMDLIDGADLRATFQSGAAAKRDAADVFRKPQRKPLGVDEVKRLRAVVEQLAVGVRALHAAGMIHRDIKPSNVLVRADDHVILVDFGLVDAAHRADARDPWTHTVRGTPGYVSPEQLRGEPPTVASDAYAIGVVLTELLTGGASMEDARRALESATDNTTRNLLALAAALLHPEPERRATIDDVLERVGVATTGRASPSPRFVGRAVERERLRATLASLSNDGAWVTVCGVPGVGKSALLGTFVEDVREDAWVFTATCRDRERVPFRGLDEIMDQLATALKTDSVLRAAVDATGAVDAVGRTFPALARAESPPPPEEGGIDARRRMFRAWRQMIARIAVERKVVLVVDDAHWGDADSGALLAMLVDEPARVMVVLATRRGSAAFGGTVESALERTGRRLDVVDVAPMTVEEARELASANTPAGGIERAIELAAGIPLLLVTLGAHTHAPSNLEIETWMSAELGELAPAASAVLELTALAAIPLREEILLAATANQAGVRQALVDLDVTRLLRRVPQRDHLTVEPFHDSVRQAVVRRIDHETSMARHRSLADAFGNHFGDSRPDVLFVHCAGAGQHETASSHGERAADVAMRALAFDTAAALFRDSAALTGDMARRDRLLERQGDALLAGGRTHEAASVFDSLDGASSEVRASSRRKAAEAYLVTGHHIEGFRIWRDAARVVGLRFPRSPVGAVVGAITALLRARFAWLRRTRNAAVALSRADAALAAAKGLIATRPMHGVFFGAESLANARAAEKPDVLVTSLSFVAAACLAAAGGVSRKWAVALLDEADAIAGDTPALRAVVTIAKAQIALFRGRWNDASARAQEGLEALAASGHARTWEASLARLARVRSLEEIGAFGPLVSEAEEWRARAGETGDVYGVVTASLTLGIASLATATVEEAESHAADADKIWQVDGYSVQRFYADRIRVLAKLQRGDVSAADSLLARVSRDVRSSMIYRIPTGRIDALSMEARVLMARLDVGDVAVVKALRAHARALAAEDHPPARAHAAFIVARLAQNEPNGDAARRIDEARDLYDRAGMVPMALLTEALRETPGTIERLGALGIVDPIAWARGHGVRLAQPRVTSSQTRTPNVLDAAR